MKQSLVLLEASFLIQFIIVSVDFSEYVFHFVPGSSLSTELLKSPLFKGCLRLSIWHS